MPYYKCIARDGLFILLILFSYLGHCGALSAADHEGPVIELSDNVSEISLKPYVSLLVDPTAQLIIDEVVRSTFHYQPPEQMVEREWGYNNTAYWMRFTLKNPTDQDIALVFDSDGRDVFAIDLYVLTFDERGKRIARNEHFRSGLRIDANDRHIYSRSIALPLVVPANSRQDLYYRTNSKYTSIPIPWVRSYPNFIESEHFASAFSYFFYGVTLGLFFYSIMVAIRLGEKSYLFFAIFLVCFLGFHGSGVGNLYYYWPDPLFIELKGMMFWLSAFLSTISFCFFTRVYLNLKSSVVYADYLQLFFVATQLYGILMLVKGNMADALFMTNFVAIFIYLLNMGVGIWLWRRGLESARYYCLACSSFCLSVLLVIVVASLFPGKYPTLIEWSMECGFLLMIILLVYGLGERINQLKQKQLNDQSNAIAAQAEAKGKSQFLATMSHEIRTPINGVLGMSDLLRDTFLNSEQKRYVESIETSGKALLGVINDILDYSKIEAGKLEIEQIDFNVEELVDECINIFSVQANAELIDFYAYVLPGTPLLIKGDPNRIRQIVLNFLSNAFKFTSEGEVKFTVSVVSGVANSASANTMLKFEVSDTGVGVSRDSQSSLFSDFAQADISTSRQYGGTGLGLAISKKLAELMGGEVGMISEPGVGSSFWCQIPLISAEKSVQDANSSEFHSALNGKKLLIVDRNDTFCEVLEALASSWGMACDVAQNKSSALLWITQTRKEGSHYDAIVLGCQAPSIDALTMAKEISASGDISKERIILAAMRRDMPSKSQLAESRINSMLEKPVTAKSLRQIIYQVLQLEGAEDSGAARREFKKFANLSVAVAEDNKINQMVITGILKKMGVSPALLDDGLAAVNSFKQSINNQKPLDLIFMDCEMPKMDGYQATQEIRRVEQDLGITPIIIVALSAHAIDEYRQRALDIGMDYYLTKPIDQDKLESLIDSINQRRYHEAIDHPPESSRVIKS